jgi:hypothetical protein
MQGRYIRKYSFSVRTVNSWKKLPETDGKEQLIIQEWGEATIERTETVERQHGPRIMKLETKNTKEKIENNQTTRVVDPYSFFYGSGSRA